MSGDLFAAGSDTAYETQYRDNKMRWLATLVAGALGYPEDDRLLIDLEPKAPVTFASTEGTSRPPSPTPPKFERGLWDSDRSPEPKHRAGRPTAAFVFSTNAALADVKSVTPVVTSLRDILNHASDEVMTRFAALVAAHFARSIETTGGRRHYSLKPVVAMLDIAQQLEWFALLGMDERGYLVFNEPKRLTIGDAMNRGLAYYR